MDKNSSEITSGEKDAASRHQEKQRSFTPETTVNTAIVKTENSDSPAAPAAALSDKKPPIQAAVSPGKAKILPTLGSLQAGTGSSAMPSLSTSTKAVDVKASPPQNHPPTRAPSNETERTVARNPTPKSPVQPGVPNLTPGISEYLRQHNDSDAFEPPPANTNPEYARKQASSMNQIQNIAQQVREMVPRPSEEAAAPKVDPSARTNKLISEMKERRDSGFSSSSAKSAAAAIQNIAFGVKTTIPPGSSTSSAKQQQQQYLMEKAARFAASKKSNEANIPKHNVVDLSHGSDEMDNDSEVARILEQRERERSSSAARIFEPTRGQSTRNPRSWEGRGWDGMGDAPRKAPTPKQQPSRAEQQQRHYQASMRSQAEEAALMQKHLLHSLQQPEQQKARTNLGSGWTAREAALIAESNPDTVQKILAAQGAPSEQQKIHWRNMKDSSKEPPKNIHARHQAIPETHQRTGSMGNDSSRRRGSNELTQNEAAMTTLVRKLLGQIAVRGDEPPIILGPQLISSISEKLKQVINRMVDIQDERSSEKRKRHGNGDEDSEHNKRLKVFAQQQADLVHEQKVLMAGLQRQLEEKNAELTDQRNEINVMRSQTRVEDDSAIRNLLKQLDTGMQTAARQKKEITALRAVINQDAADIQQKEDVITALKSQLDHQETTMRQLRQDASSRDELAALRQELREKKDALESERRQTDTTTRSYMRAAVHALKVQYSRQVKE